MEYRPIANAGPRVSLIALGTVELGMDYGFQGSALRKKPERGEAIRIIHRALDLGINLIDSAPTYGTSEEIIGEALVGIREKPLLASKVAVPDHVLAAGNWKKLRSEILNTIDASLTALKVEKLDLLQLHNTSRAVLDNEEVLCAMEDACLQGKVRFLGASCVGTQVTEAALGTGRFQVLQLPFNLLDRQMLARVFPQAHMQGVGILARSAFLRGVLTGNLSTVPDSLSQLKEAAVKLFRECNNETSSLSEMALRFCLSFNAVSSVIIGVRSLLELETNIADSSRGPLSEDCLRRLCEVSPIDRSLVNPATWRGLI